MNKPNVRTWIEIDKSAIKNNYQIFRNLIGKKCLLMGVVKSNAYGHGLFDFSHELEKLGIDWLGVDSIVEALALRKNGIKKPILVLGYTLPVNIVEASKNDISLVVSSFESLEDIKKSNLPINIHIKIDSGMHRQGFFNNELKKLTDEIKKNPKIKVEGIFTHFAAAKNPSFPADTNEQLKKFLEAFEIFKKAGLKPIRHSAASSGAILFPDSHLDMVRIGIGMYGLWPSKEVKFAHENNIHLKPVLTWKTIVSEIKNIPKGSKIGYDFSEQVIRDSKIAICPIGYWHGYPRNLSSIGNFLIKGERAKILGRVSMDMIVVDVSGIKNIKVGDEVTIIGKDGKDEITAEELSDRSDSSWYEIITRINPLIKRSYI